MYQNLKNQKKIGEGEFTEEDFVGDPSLGVAGVHRDILARVKDERLSLFGTDVWRNQSV